MNTKPIEELKQALTDIYFVKGTAHDLDILKDAIIELKESRVIVNRAEKLENAVEFLIEKGPEYLMDYIHHPNECECKSCVFFGEKG